MLKQTRLFYSDQLLDIALRKFKNINYPKIWPILAKKFGLSIVLLFAFPTTSVIAQQRDWTWGGSQGAVAAHDPLRGDLTVFYAQITPDESLPTSVEQQGENRLNINGGEREGNNLFHSFEEFSVPEGIEAVFKNAPDIENIFTRITGDAASAINGILRTQGGANFFLVNPNGIVFGENAQLDVGGSFIATTANSLQFEDGTEFIASRGQEKPILTVSVPIGLGFLGNNGSITVNGTGNQIVPSFSSTPTTVDDNEAGLSIDSGKTLALVGSKIILDGGTITTSGGLIELGSVNSGSVSLQDTQGRFKFNYENADDYQNIDLTNLSVLDVSGEGRGAIFLTGKNIALKDGSLFLNQNRGALPSDTITIDATNSLTLTGTSPDGNVSSAIRSEAVSSGEGANVNISTKQILLRDGGRIGATTYSDTIGGDLYINSTESVQLLDSTNINSTRQTFLTSSIATTTYGIGDAGSVELSTSRLKITSGGAVTSTTIGTGTGGNVTVNSEIIEIKGIESERNASSALSSSSVNSGSAGNLTINTAQLQVIDGAIVTSSAFATGNAGNLTINASELIEVSGENNNLSSRITSAIAPLASEAARERLGVPDVPTGQGGNVNINTPFLNVTHNGTISVENEGLGDGGKVSINAEELNLSETGKITATTASGIGGNIDLNTDNLQINEGSQITSTADNDGDGGNITINTANLIAKKNSQVTAKAFQGRGGNININAQGLFLFDSPDKIFSASSELGIDGTIQINTPDINLQRELEQSELEFLTTETALAKSCLLQDSQSSLIFGGTGGLPESPNSEYSNANFSLTGVISLPQLNPSSQSVTEETTPLSSSFWSSPSLPIIPANRIITTSDGRTLLVAGPHNSESLVCQPN